MPSKYAMLLNEFENQAGQPPKTEPDKTLEEYAQQLIASAPIVGQNVKVYEYDTDGDNRLYVVFRYPFNNLVAEIQFDVEEEPVLTGFEIWKDGKSMAVADRLEYVKSDLTEDTAYKLVELFKGYIPDKPEEEPESEEDIIADAAEAKRDAEKDEQ